MKSTTEKEICVSPCYKGYPATQVQYALTILPVALTTAAQTLCGVSAIFIV